MTLHTMAQSRLSPPFAPFCYKSHAVLLLISMISCVYFYLYMSDHFFFPNTYTSQTHFWHYFSGRIWNTLFFLILVKNRYRKNAKDGHYLHICNNMHTYYLHICNNWMSVFFLIQTWRTFVYLLIALMLINVVCFIFRLKVHKVKCL